MASENGPAGAATVGNLRRGGVKPLRGTARAASPAETRRLSVEEMKNGGALDFGGLLAEGAPAPAPAASGATLRQRYPGGQTRTSARQARNSDLNEAERLQKLAEIKKSATDYESMFVDMLVKQMRPSPITRTPGGDTFSEIAEQPFRNFLSQAGGLGLADSLVGQIARQEGLEQTLQEHPEVMGPAYRPTIPKSLRRTVPLGLALAPGPKAAGDRHAGEPMETAAPEGIKNPAKTAAPETAAPGGMKKQAGSLSAAEINFLYQEANASVPGADPV